VCGGGSGCCDRVFWRGFWIGRVMMVVCVCVILGLNPCSLPSILVIFEMIFGLSSIDYDYVCIQCFVLVQPSG
jgi:hypothetical protein